MHSVARLEGRARWADVGGGMDGALRIERTGCDGMGWVVRECTGGVGAMEERAEAGEGGRERGEKGRIGKKIVTIVVHATYLPCNNDMAI